MHINPAYSQAQRLINCYIEDFKERSNGFDLGIIEYLGYYSDGESEASGEVGQYFLSIPVKNQETTIIGIIQRAIENIPEPWTLGLLFDNCEDLSEAKCRNFMEKYNWSKSSLIAVHMIKSKKDLFESTCENLLSLFCSSPLFVSLQADCYLSDSTFLKRTQKAFSLEPKLLGISGRAVVPFLPISKWQMIADSFQRKIISLGCRLYKKNRRILGSSSLTLGYFGDTADYPHTKMKFTETELETLYLGEAVIRGPIVWDYAKFVKLDRFNDIAYFLGRDDCDISFRGLNYNFFVGYLPCRSYSITENGTTRRPRSEEATKSLQERSRLAENFEGELGEYWKDMKSCRSLIMVKKIRNRRKITTLYLK